jgi:hypothetical protein
MPKLARARQVRNGLMVAMLAMHPIRLKNFASLKIGRNFVEIKGSWWIALSAAEPKEDRPDERRIDDLLQPALDRYLKKYRPLLAGADRSTTALWLSSNDGEPMSYDGVARALTETTRSTVGVAVARICSEPQSPPVRLFMAAQIHTSRARSFITQTTASPKRTTIAHQA